MIEHIILGYLVISLTIVVIATEIDGGDGLEFLQAILLWWAMLAYRAFCELRRRMRKKTKLDKVRKLKYIDSVEFMRYMGFKTISERNYWLKVAKLEAIKHAHQKFMEELH